MKKKRIKYINLAAVLRSAQHSGFSHPVIIFKKIVVCLRTRKTIETRTCVHRMRFEIEFMGAHGDYGIINFGACVLLFGTALVSISPP